MGKRKPHSFERGAPRNYTEESCYSGNVSTVQPEGIALLAQFGWLAAWTNVPSLAVLLNQPESEGCPGPSKQVRYAKLVQSLNILE